MSIWRTYKFGGNKKARSIDILNESSQIHKALFSQDKISKYGEEDAKLLTTFFRNYKELEKKKTFKDELGNIVVNATMKELIGGKNTPKIAVKLPFLHFEGAEAEAEKFEVELNKLIDKSYQPGVKTKGSDSAAIYLNLGKYNKEGTQKKDFVNFVTEVLGKEQKDFVDSIQKTIKDKVIIHDNSFYVKIEAARSGKIDVSGKGGGGANIVVQGEPTETFSHIIDMLENATFSVKSYRTDAEVKLGDTKIAKAISGVASYVAMKDGNLNRQAPAIFFLKYPTKESALEREPHQQEAVNELYDHYTHMKEIYELSGLGLTYNEKVNDLDQVDFLIENRTKGDIIVHSAREMAKEIGAKKGYL